MTKSPLFWEIHSGLPREGPGDNVSTRMAFSMVEGLPRAPRILDVGCGPGMQTLELARLSDDASITAVDVHRPFLDELNRRARAAGVANRITAVQASMFDLPFAPGDFDLIWCEGAAYFMGVGQALTAWRPLLADNGHIALTELCWIKADPPAEVVEAWAEYPDMGTVEQAGAIIAASGYDLVGRFTLPEASWWDDYYTPMQARLAGLDAKYAGASIDRTALDQARRELDLRRRHGEYYGYVFFVARKAGAL
jgi:SAM-dependent methyltransferase